MISIAVAALAIVAAAVGNEDASIEVDTTTGNLLLSAPSGSRVELQGDALITGTLTNTALAQELMEIRSACKCDATEGRLTEEEMKALRLLIEAHKSPAPPPPSPLTCRLSAAGTASGVVSFSADWHNTYDCAQTASGGNSFKNTFCYAFGASSRWDKDDAKPRVAAINGTGLHASTCSFTRDFLAEKGSTLKGCASYDYECLKDVDVVYHVADAQQGDTHTISSEEGEYLLDFVKCGGSVLVYHGHQAATAAPLFAEGFKATFGVEMVETGVCLSQSDTPMYALKTLGIPVALYSNPSCGGVVDAIGWNNNCHENLKIDADHPVGQYAKAVYTNGDGHTTCNSHCEGMVASGELHIEQVIIEAGALD